jgi:hypothetical protein
MRRCAPALCTAPSPAHLLPPRAQLVAAELILWDIPTGLLVDSLREPVMMAHHVGMAAVALAGCFGVWSFYAVFFFGVIELSGILLAFVDLFHPKHQAWCDYLATAPRLQPVNAAARAAFLLAFIGCRALWFPYVVLGRVLPDALELHGAPEAGIGAFALWSVPVSGVAFSVLQLFWAAKLIKMARKMLLGGKPKAE